MENLSLDSGSVFLGVWSEYRWWYSLFGCSLHAPARVLWFRSGVFVRSRGSAFLGDISLLDLNTIRVKTPLVVRLSPLVLINFKQQFSVISRNPSGEFVSSFWCCLSRWSV